MGFWFQFIIAIALYALSYVIMPKPKIQKPEAAQDLEGPTAEAGRPIPVPFGTVTIQSPNCLWWGDKRVREYSVSA